MLTQKASDYVGYLQSTLRVFESQDGRLDVVCLSFFGRISRDEMKRQELSKEPEIDDKN